jgi:hypothetical protein
VDESSSGLIEVLIWNFPGWTEENHENFVKVQTERLLNKSVQHYHYTNPLDQNGKHLYQ